MSTRDLHVDKGFNVPVSTPIAIPDVTASQSATTRYKTRHFRMTGFTLVELVTVLTILAVLGAAAAPKLFDLVSESRTTSIKVTVSAFSQAIQMAHFACTAESWRNRDNLPGYGSGDVDFNDACFPTDTNNQNIITNQNQRCLRVWNAILNPAPSIQTGNGGNATYRAFASGGVCRYRYLDIDPPVEFTYDSSNGTVAMLP